MTVHYFCMRVYLSYATVYEMSLRLVDLNEVNSTSKFRDMKNYLWTFFFWNISKTVVELLTAAYVIASSKGILWDLCF